MTHTKINLVIVSYKLYQFFKFNRDCFPHFELFGTSKNDTPPKVSVHHGMKKYMNEICLPCLLTELWLFVYILWQCKK